MIHGVRICIACVAALLLLTGAGPAARAVEKSRLERLARGVNIPHWFWAAPGLDEAHIRNYFTTKDAALLREAGLRHVRLPVEVSLLSDWASGGGLKEDGMRLLEQALEMLVSSGLAVTVCPFGDLQEKASEPGLTERAAEFWEALARRLSRFDPETLFLEVANEPSGTPAVWEPVQRKLLEAMRRGAPRHTLVTATPLRSGREDDPWHTAEALAEMSPVKDRNVVYNFHFYEPFWFTHQGATWAGPAPRGLRGVPYPSSPDKVSTLVADLKERLKDTEVSWLADVIRSYGEERWDAERIERQLRPAVEWARRHSVPLMVNEFGVYRPFCAPADRLAWLRDVRQALEKHGAAWCMWDYSGGFSLSSGEPGARTLDPDTLRALAGQSAPAAAEPGDGPGGEAGGETG